MALSLAQAQVVHELAELLYDFLPGSGAPWWKGHVSFATVAREAGVGDFWEGGSKKSAIIRLFERTLAERPIKLEPLIVSIVKHGCAYRRNNGRPVRRPEIERLNVLILRLGFRFPQLWQDEFLSSLSEVDLAPADGKAAGDEQTPAQPTRAALLGTFRERFYELSKASDRQAAGRQFQEFLVDLFDLFGLSVRGPYRVTGEEIDGSFELDHETYLLEAKWTKYPIAKSDLLAFERKVEAKSAYTRGLFISVNGFSQQAIDSMGLGKDQRLFCADGYDLAVVLEGSMDLCEMLRRKRRRLTEEGLMFARVND